jgi:hypothetical protein
MKIKFFTPLPLLVLALLCVEPGAFAQPKAAPTNSSTTPAATAPKKLDSFDASGLYLRAAVAKLQESLVQNRLPSINVLFGPGTEQSEISSSVVLRHVSGPDALQLIAAAANCTVETMTSTDELVPAPATPGLPTPTAMRPAVIGYVIHRRNDAPPRMLAPAATPGLPGNSGLSGPGLPMRSSRSGGVEAMGGLNSVRGKLTRVYPLGTVTAYTKFPDLAKALEDILRMDGIPSDQVQLAVHEKVNVLVVNAPESVHVLIEQFLNVLERNTQVMDRQNSMDKMRAEKEVAERAMQNQMQRAREEVERANAEAAKRALQQEQQKRQDAAKKKTGEP